MLSGRVSAQPAQSVIDIIYISPGVQISAPPGKAQPLALSLQVTVGLILDNVVIKLPVDPPAMGVTFGVRKSQGMITRFIDGQVHYGIIGLGVGRVWAGDNAGYRYKLFGGLLAYATYDRTYLGANPPVGHWGLIAVLPLPLTPVGFGLGF